MRKFINSRLLVLLLALAAFAPQSFGQTQSFRDRVGAVIRDSVQSTSSYQVYTALLTQTGTDAPVATVLENTLGATITWTRTGEGVYLGTASSAVFTEGKTAKMIDPNGAGIYSYFPSTTVFQVQTWFDMVTQAASDDALSSNLVQIFVYP